MSYYLGSNSYPHPKDPTRVLCYVRNRTGLRVSLSPGEALKVKPYDLFQDKAGNMWCKTVLNKQFPLAQIIPEYTLYHDVQIVT